MRNLRVPIRRMSLENSLWGAPRIHGKLLKLGFAVAQSTVAKYMVRTEGGPSGQSWSIFLRIHMPQIAAMDLFVVPTIGFNLLYVLVIVRLARRELVWINVTTHPTAEWLAQQITEAAERLIGSIRRECVDHVVAFGEQHLRQVLKSYASYYNTARTHRSLDKDAPVSRPVQRIGRIVSHAVVGGLHHQYVRI